MRQHFTRKERDNETGLDYFGARYYASTQGRFTSVDPSRRSVEPTEPQTWNRYSYCFNNPLTQVDRNGKWPTPTHNKIIDNSFKGLSTSQKDILKEASRRVDDDQSKEGAYKHGMRAPGESKLSAALKSASFVAGAVSDAAWIQYQYQSGGGKGISDEALARVGEAIHTVTDETSPSHKGFQVWHGADDVVSILEATVHIGRESLHISSSQMNAAVGAAQSIFAEALPEFATQAFGQQQPTPRHDEEEQQQQQENRVHNEDTQNLEEREHKN